MDTLSLAAGVAFQGVVPSHLAHGTHNPVVEPIAAEMLCTLAFVRLNREALRAERTGRPLRPWAQRVLCLLPPAAAAEVSVRQQEVIVVLLRPLR